MSEIEAQRLANLQNKEKLLAELNLNSKTVASVKAQTVKRENGTATKKRKVVSSLPPTRASARIQQASERPTYIELGADFKEPPLRTRTKARTRPTTVKLSRVKEEIVLRSPPPDVETMRENWSKWEVTGPSPTRDEGGTLHFEDHPLFLPNKSPEEMIREGCFGGSYWRPVRSRRLGIIIQGDWEELPSTWIEGLDVESVLISPDYDADVNKYKVACGQSIEEWEASGWIMHEFDVRGWFQWYCRFYQGRRCPDDDRQVSRWRKCVGATGRWKRMLLKAYLKMGVRDVFDDGEDEETREVSPVMHQTCHHWAYEIKQQDLDEAWQER